MDTVTAVWTTGDNPEIAGIIIQKDDGYYPYPINHNDDWMEVKQKCDTLAEAKTALLG